MTTCPPYEGRHLIAELHDAAHLEAADFIEAALRDAALAAGATILDVRLHHFGPGHGVTGVALLAESHISIHTWPEHGYAAIDIFMCGRANDVDAALAVIAARLEARIASHTLIERGFGAAVQPA